MPNQLLKICSLAHSRDIVTVLRTALQVCKIPQIALIVQWQQTRRTRYSSSNPQTLIQYQVALPPLASWPIFPTRRHSGVNSPYQITSLGHPSQSKQLASPNQQDPIRPSSAKPSLTPELKVFITPEENSKHVSALAHHSSAGNKMSTQGD